MTGSFNEYYLLSPNKRHIFKEMVIREANIPYADYGNTDPGIDNNNYGALYYPNGLVVISPSTSENPWFAGTMMHEIGHTLSLGHGGNDGVNWKPNYVSVMNYVFQNGVNRHNMIDYSSGLRSELKMALSVYCVKGALNCTKTVCDSLFGYIWDVDHGCIEPGLWEQSGIDGMYMYPGEFFTSEEWLNDSEWMASKITNCTKSGYKNHTVDESIFDGQINSWPMHINWNGNTIINNNKVFAYFWSKDSCKEVTDLPATYDYPLRDHDDWHIVTNIALSRNTGIFANNGDNKQWPCDDTIICKDSNAVCSGGKCTDNVSPAPSPPPPYNALLPFSKLTCLK